MEDINKKSNQRKSIAIIYHYPCFDGSYAAVSAYLYYSHLSRRNNKMTFFPIRNEENITKIKLTDYDKVIILDKGLHEYEMEHVENLIKIKPSIEFLVIDHHLSYIETYLSKFQSKFEGNNNIRFILNKENLKSACGLTLDYYEAKALVRNDSEKIKKVYTDNYKRLIEYVEDSDTGQFIKPLTCEFKSGLGFNLRPKITICDFRENPVRRINEFISVDWKYCVRSGEGLYKKYKKGSLNEISGDKCYITKFDSYMFIICLTENKQYRNYACPILSEISAMKGMSPIAGFLYRLKDNIYKLSLRTHDNEFDLGEFCKSYGGGGHKKAAAFTQEISFFKERIIKKVDLNKDVLRFK